MIFLSNLPAGDVICAGVKSLGVGVEVELSEMQAEQPLRKKYVITPPPANQNVDEVENQAPVRKK